MMRPSPGGPAPSGRSRKSSVAEDSRIAPPPASAPGHGVPTTFFLRSEEQMAQMAQMEQQQQSSLADDNSATRQRDNVYGVQSLEDVLSEQFGSGRSDGERERDWQSQKGARLSKKRKIDPGAARATPERRRSVTAVGVSLPATPSRLESPVPESGFLGTPKSVSIHSFRSTDEDSGGEDAGSQAVVSSSEEEELGTGTGLGLGKVEKEAPQLVMPSIRMPSRRPFTARGKSMGRLKVMVAGAAGAGKTSLIKSIVQVCEDIVHVDPFFASPPMLESPASPRLKNRDSKADAGVTKQIHEIYASTRAYPPWWSEMEESRILRRRKSGDDVVLERNIWFIDTPGYKDDSKVSLDRQTDSVVRYLESLLHRNASITAASDSDLLGVLSGTGGVQVDVVLFVFSESHNLKHDMAYFKRLSHLTNVIPIIGKADKLSTQQLSDLRLTILNNFQVLSIRPFLFGRTIDEAIKMATRDEPTISNMAPFAISSAAGTDTDTMDASLLMSPDYVRPLAPSDLGALIEKLFDPDNISWLRHAAVKKFIRWRADHAGVIDHMAMHGSALGISTSNDSSNNRSPNLNTQLALNNHNRTTLPAHDQSPQSNTCSFPSSPPHHPLPTAPPTSYALARLTDHTQREHRLAQARLATWAADLQRSLHNERLRFEALARRDQAVWLLERVGDGAGAGAGAGMFEGRFASRDHRADWAVAKSGGAAGGSAAIGVAGRNVRTARVRRLLDPRDPLRLCALGERVARAGWVVVRVLGGLGALGAVLVAVVRAVDGGAGGSGWPFRWHAQSGGYGDGQQSSEGGMVMARGVWEWLCGNLWWSGGI